MNTLFNGREIAFEARLKCDQDLKFHAQALSNMRFGVWLGGKLGLSTEESEAYGHKLVETRLNAMVREEMIKTIMNDLVERDADIREDEVHKALDRFYADALREVTRNGE